MQKQADGTEPRADGGEGARGWFLGLDRFPRVVRLGMLTRILGARELGGQGKGACR